MFLHCSNIQTCAVYICAYNVHNACMIHGWYCTNMPVVQEILPLSLLLEWFWVSVPLLEAPWLGFKPQSKSPVFTAVPYYFFSRFTHRDLHSGTWIRGIKRTGEKSRNPVNLDIKLQTQHISQDNFKCNVFLASN